MIYRESKVYFDGSHYIAIPHTNRPPSNRRKPIEELIEVRHEQSVETVAKSTGLVREEVKEIRTATAEPDFSDDDVFEEGCVCLTPETAPFPFAFDDEPQSEEHNPATVRMTRKDLFEQLYAQTADLPRKDRKASILSAMLPYFQDEFAAKMFVEENFNRKIRNLVARKIRLARKANLQEFNYFCTFTYDDKLHDEGVFRKKLTNCLSLFSSRKKWRYIGVWERSPEKNRLHFHGVFHIPGGTMPGELVEVNDYSFAIRQRQVTLQNTYFNKRFGRSDFELIDEQSSKVEALAYILKYIEKTGEKVVYSKGLSQFFISDIMEDDVVCRVGVDDRKLLLFDDFGCWDEGCYVGQVSKEVIEQMRRCN